MYYQSHLHRRVMQRKLDVQVLPSRLQLRIELGPVGIFILSETYLLWCQSESLPTLAEELKRWGSGGWRSCAKRCATRWRRWRRCGRRWRSTKSSSRREKKRRRGRKMKRSLRWRVKSNTHKKLYNIETESSGSWSNISSFSQKAQALTRFLILRKSREEMVRFFYFELENWMFISRDVLDCQDF